MSFRTIQSQSKLGLMLVVFASLIALAPAHPANAAANLVTNGSFESGTDDWITSNVDVVHAVDGWFVGDGDSALDLNGSNSGSISQDIALTVDHRFRASFRLAANPQCGSGIKTFTASAGSNPGTNFLISTGGEPIGHIAWVTQQFFFESDSSTETISFVSTNPGLCGPMLDSIEVTDLGPKLPTTKAECLKGAWESYGVFKNQGDCVSYIATDGKNPPAGA